MPGSHKCPQCQKSFGTKQALMQHERDAHAKGRKTGPKKSRSRQAADVGGPTGGPTAYQPIRQQQVEDDRSTHYGVDRVFHVEDISVYSTGAVLVSLPISAGSFSRLSVLAEAYQQLRFLQLEFRVASYAAANVGGGYVAGFVKDPDDQPPAGSNARLNWITAQPGSVTTRWPQQAVIRATVSDRWFYTSPGVEIRESSPGSFYLIVDSKATAAAALTIWAHWRVSFRKATLEPSVVKTLTAGVDLYTQNGHIGLFYKVGSAFKDDNDTMFPGWKKNMVLSLQTPLYIAHTTDQSTTVTRVVWWLKFTSDQDCQFCYESPDSPTTEKAAVEALVIRKGTAFEIVQTSNLDKPGEVKEPRPSNSEDGACASSRSSERSSDLLMRDLIKSVSCLSSDFRSLMESLLAQGRFGSKDTSKLEVSQVPLSGQSSTRLPQWVPLPLNRSPPPLTEEDSGSEASYLNDAP